MKNIEQKMTSNSNSTKKTVKIKEKSQVEFRELTLTSVQLVGPVCKN